MPDRSDGISLRSGFLRSAASGPNAPAIVVRKQVRTYAELEDTARRYANGLLTVCGKRPERVGLFAYRSETAYAGTLAALFAGATYVPLNPSFPPDKTTAMAEAADLDAIIVDSACAAFLPIFAGRSDVRLVMPEFEGHEVKGLQATILNKSDLLNIAPLQALPPLSAEDVAYLLFTSGSTGKPKGVPVTHANAIYFMDVMSRRYKITSGDRFSQTFDQTFDLSVFDLFVAWSNGACVYGMSPVDLLSPTKFINNNNLTVWFSVPSVAAQMVRRGTLTSGSLPTLRLSLFCGEPLAQRSAELWQEAAPNSIVENLYGPTELTIACFLHRWDPHTSPAMCRNAVVPIGRPYDGLAALIVDSELQPVADGEPGELLVNGPQTTPGYWRDPQNTAERYVTLSISAYENRRFYRTGDLVAKLDNGEYTFLGRADFQIKVLGHRVELGEIEAALRTHPDVEHAVACGWPQSSPTTADGIVAFVTGNQIDVNTLLEVSRRQLPPYIVPRQIFVLDEMPLNSNGKVDRRALEAGWSQAKFPSRPRRALNDAPGEARRDWKGL